jgi:hypothetical protein
MTAGDFNIPLSPIDSSSRPKKKKKINKEIRPIGLTRLLQSILSNSSFTRFSKQQMELSPK